MNRGRELEDSWRNTYLYTNLLEPPDTVPSRRSAGRLASLADILSARLGTSDCIELFQPDARRAFATTKAASDNATTGGRAYSRQLFLNDFDDGERTGAREDPRVRADGRFFE